jgi:hypothetical protein
VRILKKKHILSLHGGLCNPSSSLGNRLQDSSELLDFYCYPCTLNVPFYGLEVIIVEEDARLGTIKDSLVILNGEFFNVMDPF